MTWIVTGVVAASTAYGAYKGGQQASAYGEGKAAAGEIKQEKLILLGGKQQLGLDVANLQYETAIDQETQQRGIVQRQTGMATRDIGMQGQAAAAQSGLATSGTIESKTSMQTGDVLGKYQSDMQKLVDTRKAERKRRDFSRTEADLSYRSGEISAEEAYQNTLSSMDEGGVGEGAIGGFVSGIKTVLSDKRLKENLDYIGDSPSGIRVYEFNYLNSDTRHRGVIANQLVDSHPNAVSKNKDGYYRVDYSQIDVNFEIVKGD